MVIYNNSNSKQIFCPVFISKNLPKVFPDCAIFKKMLLPFLELCSRLLSQLNLDFLTSETINILIKDL